MDCSLVIDSLRVSAPLRLCVKTIDTQSIPEMVDELTRQEIATWYKDGKLTPHGREMAKFLDRAFPAEKVDKWGFLLTRKEREAIKRKAAERKRLAAEKRAKTAAIRKIRANARKNGFGPEDELNDFASIHWAFMAAHDELKVRGFSLDLMNKLKADVVARISPWNMQHHVDYIKYFIYQYYLSCSELHVATLPASQQEQARQGWTKILRPFKCREPWLSPLRS